ncbi:MAG: hypothetical protein HY897_15545 [Deltaproteobacteria bacterium]|nr:hypothetical protein [Deltaproteobacteria bacterium]
MKNIVPLLVLLCASPALAADVGEIALIEDTDGSINASVAIGTTYLQKTACAFYKTHDDDFGALFVFTTYKLTMFGTPEGWAIKRGQKGIGFDIYPDSTSKFCSTTGSLRHAMKLGDLSKWADDPDAPYTAAVNGVYDGIEVIGHEFGHYWLAGANYKEDNGTLHCHIRALAPGGSGGSDCDNHGLSEFHLHWSYFFNARSPMFGSFIDDLGGARFKIYHDHPGYSDLDQYLMGLRDKSEVAPMFVVDTGNLDESSTTPLPIGQSREVSGDRVDFDIDDVIRALGPRVPAKDPCHWKGAFIIVHPKGQAPSAQVIARVDAYRKRWETWYDRATSNRGSFDTTLSGNGAGTQTCPSGAPPDAGFPDAGQPDSGAVTDAATDAGAPDVSEMPDTGADVGEHDAGPAEEDAGKEDVAGDDVLDAGGTSDDSGTAPPIDGGGDASPPAGGNETTAGCSCMVVGP